MTDSDRNLKKKYIDSMNESFLGYLQIFALDDDMFRLLNHLCAETEVYLFSGVIRDFFLGDYYNIRDIDFVIGKDINYSTFKGEIDQLRRLDFNRNSFGGLKVISGDGPNVDLWTLDATWGIKQLNIKNPAPEDLLKTVFFNFSAILYDVRNRKFIYSDSFVDFLNTGTIDIVYPDNPNNPLCLFNLFYYSKKLNAPLSAGAKKWMKNNYLCVIDFHKVQMKHINKVIYSNEEIYDFINSQIRDV